MNNNSFSEFNNLPEMNDDFSFDTSTPVVAKRFRKTRQSGLNVCNISCEFITDDFFDDFDFENSNENGNVIVPDKEIVPLPAVAVLSPDSFTNESNKTPIRTEEREKQDENTSPFCQSQFHGGKSSSPRKRKASENSFVFSPSQSLSENNSMSDIIIKKLQMNASCSPRGLFNRQVKKTSLLYALNEAQKLHDQLSQSAVGPFFGLPSKMAELLKRHKGIDDLYSWQKECLTLPAVRQKKNLIYSLPTSGGKTLVAEILIMRELLCYLKDSVLVLPYISLVQEKVRGLAPFAVDLDFVIEECAGIKGTIPPRKRRKRHTLYICTIEKAHSLVNSMIEAKRMDEIGLIVVDELHMIGERGRGAVLESLLTKVIFVSKRTQIIGMSATLSNMSDLRSFLDADMYEKDFRPIELKEYVKVANELYELVDKRTEEWRLARTLDFKYSRQMMTRDPDMITGLVSEVIPDNSCLVFCPTKKHCENVAKMLCEFLPDSAAAHRKEERDTLLRSLREDGNGNICDILKESLRFGVAYHHSGLTMDERKLIEEAYLNGILCCLTCTSTLAAGVNLPAKRVILRAPYIGKEFITLSRYKQMVGRAGRAGIDDSGESILIIRPTDRPNVGKLLTSDMDSCHSNFVTEPERLDTLVLSLFGLGIAKHAADVYSFMDKTLAAVQNKQNGSTPSSTVEDTVKRLRDHELLRVEEAHDSSDVTVTQLGKAVFKGGVDIATMEEFLKRLNQGLSGLVLHSYLHLLYLVTPAEFSTSIPFSSDIFYQAYTSLDPNDIAVAEQVGISERLVMLMASGRSAGKHQTLLHHFYLSLILYDLWKQNSVWRVSHKFQVHRGVIQNLLNSASALASTLSNFCQELGEFWAYQQLFPGFVKQLSYCVTTELIPLMELPSVKRGRAKQLYVAGYKTLQDVAKASPRELVDKIVHLPHKLANQIVSAAKMIIMEKAETLQEEAEMLLEEFDKNFTMLNDGFDLSALP